MGNGNNKFEKNSLVCNYKKIPHAVEVDSHARIDMAVQRLLEKIASKIKKSTIDTSIVIDTNYGPHSSVIQDVTSIMKRRGYESILKPNCGVGMRYLLILSLSGPKN